MSLLLKALESVERERLGQHGGVNGAVSSLEEVFVGGDDQLPTNKRGREEGLLSVLAQVDGEEGGGKGGVARFESLLGTEEEGAVAFGDGDGFHDRGGDGWDLAGGSHQKPEVKPNESKKSPMVGVAKEGETGQPTFGNRDEGLGVGERVIVIREEERGIGGETPFGGGAFAEDRIRGSPEAARMFRDAVAVGPVRSRKFWVLGGGALVALCTFAYGGYVYWQNAMTVSFPNPPASKADAVLSANLSSTRSRSLPPSSTLSSLSLSSPVSSTAPISVSSTVSSSAPSVSPVPLPSVGSKVVGSTNSAPIHPVKKIEDSQRQVHSDDSEIASLDRMDEKVDTVMVDVQPVEPARLQVRKTKPGGVGRVKKAVDREVHGSGEHQRKGDRPSFPEEKKRDDGDGMERGEGGEAVAAIHPEVMSRRLTELREAFARGREKEAGEGFLDVLAREPGNRDALFGLAAVKIRQGRMAEAEGYYLKLLELNPSDSVAMAGLSGIRADVDPLRRESLIKNILQREPDAHHLYFALGGLYAAQKRWVEAQQAYFRAMSGKSDNPDYAFNLAVSLDHLGQRDSALGFYRKAVELSSVHRGGFALALAENRIRALGATSDDRPNAHVNMDSLQ